MAGAIITQGVLQKFEQNGFNYKVYESYQDNLIEAMLKAGVANTRTEVASKASQYKVVAKKSNGEFIDLFDKSLEFLINYPHNLDIFLMRVPEINYESNLQ